MILFAAAGSQQPGGHLWHSGRMASNKDRWQKARRCNHGLGTSNWCKNTTKKPSGNCGQHKDAAVPDSHATQNVNADLLLAVANSNPGAYVSAADDPMPETDPPPVDEHEHAIVLESRKIPTGIVGVIRDRVEGMNRRAKREVVRCDIERVPGNDFALRVDIKAVGDFTYPQGRLLGAWDFSIDGDDSEPLCYGKELEGAPPDRLHCDHCGKRRKRNQIFVFEDDSGNRVHLGSQCLKDKSGTTLRNLLFYSSKGRLLDDLDDVTLGTHHGAETEEFVAAAALAHRRSGTYIATRQPDSSALFASYLYSTRGWGDDLPYPLNSDLLHWQGTTPQDATEGSDDEWEEAENVAAAALEWARNLEPKNDFEQNMQKVAKSEWIGKRAIGVAAYLPVAYLKSVKDKQAPKSKTSRTMPVPEGRREHEGVVLSVERREDYFGNTVLKAMIRCDGYDIWGTLPRMPDKETDRDKWRYEQGDHIKFRADATQKEIGFGYYKRPTKPVLIEHGKPNLQSAETDEESTVE